MMRMVYMTKRGGLANHFRRHWQKHLMMLPLLIILTIFNYVPMAGILMAFQNYMPRLGIFKSPWVGWQWFEYMFKMSNFTSVVWNTLFISLLKIFTLQAASLIFALMLNEVRSDLFKRIVQTSSYLPHFISWIVVSGLCYTMFSTVNGMINQLLMNLGMIKAPLTILTSESAYWGLAIGTEIWKETGWNAIIFIAAIAGIEPVLYEAAEIDGATRLQRIWHITVPGIKGTIIIMFILSLGSLVNGNLDQALLMGNDLNRGTSEIINSYVLTLGLRQFRFDYAAAVGLMQSFVSVVLVFSSNAISRKLVGASLY